MMMMHTNIVSSMPLSWFLRTNHSCSPERMMPLETKFTGPFLTFFNHNLVPYKIAVPGSLLHAPREEGLPNVPTCHRPSHIRFEHLWVIPQHSSSIMVERIFVVGLLHPQTKVW